MNEASQQSDLSKLRQDIDRIDSELHDLIMERAALMDAISAAKKASSNQAFFLRPGREAHIQRRLWDRHKSNFPLVSLLRMWREMINGMTSLQTDLKVSFYPGDRPDRFTNLVSNQFGSTIPLISETSPEQAFNRLESGEVTAAVIPVPNNAELASWWQDFSAMRDSFSVIMRLPFVRAGNIWPTAADDQLEALVLSRGKPEQSGEDYTLLAANLSNSEWRPADQSPLSLVAHSGDFALFALPGFHGEGEIERQLPTDAKDHLISVEVYGAYASPIQPS